MAIDALLCCGFLNCSRKTASVPVSLLKISSMHERKATASEHVSDITALSHAANKILLRRIKGPRGLLPQPCLTSLAGATKTCATTASAGCPRDVHQHRSESFLARFSEPLSFLSAVSQRSVQLHAGKQHVIGIPESTPRTGLCQPTSFVTLCCRLSRGNAEALKSA